MKIKSERSVSENMQKIDKKMKAMRSGDSASGNKGRVVHIVMNVDRCVCCGEIVPEGYMVCSNCEAGNSVSRFR